MDITLPTGSDTQPEESNPSAESNPGAGATLGGLAGGGVRGGAGGGVVGGDAVDVGVGTAGG